MMRRTAVALGLVGAAFLARPESPQEAPKPQDPVKAAEAAAVPVPKPGPEHAVLAEDVGTWDFTNKMYFEPGKPPALMKGTYSTALMPGGLWMFSDWKATDGSFHGHLVLGYDARAKKYRGTWVDSWTSTPFSVEGVFDAEKRVMTSTLRGVDATGAPSELIETVEYVSAKVRKATFRMEVPGMGKVVIMESAIDAPLTARRP
jgi:hypothetical protein